MRLTKVRTAAVGAAVVLGLAMAPAMHGQQRRPRRESTANRKARIERTIRQTYEQRWEAAGQGGFLRFRDGQNLQQTSEATYAGTLLYSLYPKLGVMGIATGGFGSAKLGNNAENAVNPQIQNYEFMAGPHYRFVTKEKYAVSGFVAGGVAWGRFSTGPHDFPPQDVGLWPSGFTGSFTAGVNLDYNLYPNLAVRVTPNYLGTTFGSTIQNNKGVNLGVVYRWGHLR